MALGIGFGGKVEVKPGIAPFFGSYYLNNSDNPNGHGFRNSRYYFNYDKSLTGKYIYSMTFSYYSDAAMEIITNNQIYSIRDGYKESSTNYTKTFASGSRPLITDDATVGLASTYSGESGWMVISSIVVGGQA